MMNYSLRTSRWVALLLLFVALFAGPLAAADKFVPPADNPDLKAVFDALKVDSPDINTQIRLLWANNEAWFARWKMIEAAKNTIDCTYYILDKDIFGVSFLGLLRKKALEGVKVRLMVDGRVYRMAYMKGMPDKMMDLSRTKNVQIKLFNPIGKSLISMFEDFRSVAASNHDKIIVVDGYTSITGGRNIGPDYFGARGEGPCIYRDTDILMRGQHAAGQMKRAFEDEWNSLKASLITPRWIDRKDYLPELDLAYRVMNRYLMGEGLFDPKKAGLSEDLTPVLEGYNKDISSFKQITGYSTYDMWHGERARPVKIVDKYSRLGGMNEITPTLCKFFDAAKTEIVIQNPYVVLTETAYAALKRASQRGVSIIFHTNSGGSTDSLFPQAFLQDDWVKMLVDMPTCHIYAAPTANERLHSKTFVIDRLITIVGTYNMDALSEQVNSELVAVVFNKEFGTMTRLRIQDDMKVVVEYTIKKDRDGKAVPDVGPASHLDKKTIDKMNFLGKLQWLRPLI
ncbi:MAG: phosphatidylserine/phosphatidylglycerophosphate/cardiolipin synthase family protein [Candidatus Ozemobacteraceae bacterium]